MISLTNGLGPEWFSAKMRNAITLRATSIFPSKPWEQHDFAYWIGGSEETRKLADRIFYIALKSEALGWKARLIAFLFYTLVRLFGGPSFNHTTKG